MTRFTGNELACRRGERLVFDTLSFALETGGALLLTGPNGSGKSSLLRLMAGLLRPEAGRIAWGGVPIDEDPAAHRLRVHFIGHLDALKPVLTVAETAAFWSGLRGGSAEESLASLARFRLESLADWPCRFLSAGQRRRLALARLVAAPAPLWLLDEPTTGLDRQSVLDLEAAIAEHRAGGGMVVASTHAAFNLPQAEVVSLAPFARAVASPSAYA